MRPEGQRLLASSDTEEAGGGGAANWTKVKSAMAAAEGKPSFFRSLSNISLVQEVAPSAHTRYDPELWLPTMRAAFDTIGPFVIRPWLGLTVLTLGMCLTSSLYDKPPWWTTMPGFAHTVLGGALSFIMVFRTNTAYSRWWEARLMWGTITVTSRSIGTQASSMLREPAHLTALLIVFPAVVKNTLRDESTEAAELSAAEALLASASTPHPAVSSLATLIAQPSPANAVVQAMAQVVRTGLVKDQPGEPEGLAASAYLHLSSDLRNLTAAATACERIKTSPMPLGYVSALRFFLLIWLVTLPLTLIGSYGGAATPAVSVIAFLFLNLENVAMEIEQPFGRDANDLPLEEYCAGIERVLLGLSRTRGAVTGAPSVAVESVS